jgi:hypothetical protein
MKKLFFFLCLSVLFLMGTRLFAPPYAGPYPQGSGGGTNIYNFYTPASVSASATNLPYGSPATASVTGTNIQTWVFGIPSGKDGINGTNGVNGINGTNGATGATGAIGATGPAGAAGANGVNGTNGVAIIYTHIFTNIDVASNGWPHNYGSKPIVVNGSINCLTNDGGMLAGQSANLFSVYESAWSAPYFSIGADSVNLIQGGNNSLQKNPYILWNGSRNSVTNWSNFTITIIYQ